MLDGKLQKFKVVLSKLETYLCHLTFYLNLFNQLIQKACQLSHLVLRHAVPPFIQQASLVNLVKDWQYPFLTLCLCQSYWIDLLSQLTLLYSPTL
jgi:hypothetical protein